MHARPSYWHQIGSEPLLPLTVGKVLDDATDRWPDRVAVLSKYQNHSFTYTEIRHKVNAFAAGLLRLGLAPGDRLAIWGHNSSQWQCAYLAATSVGIIVVNRRASNKGTRLTVVYFGASGVSQGQAKLDPAATPKEVLTNLKKIEPRAIVCAEYYNTSNCVEAVGHIRSELGCPIVIAISDKQYPDTIRFQDVSSDVTPELLNKVQELKKLVQPDCGCDIIFTSGTTGHPKGALLSHHALLNGVLITGRRGQYCKQVCKWCVTTQFCHVSGTAAILSSISFGMTLVIPGPVYNANEVVSAIIEEECTNAIAIPSQCVDFIQIVKEKNLRISHLKYLMVSGAPISAALVNALKDSLESVNVLDPLSSSAVDRMLGDICRGDDFIKFNQHMYLETDGSFTVFYDKSIFPDGKFNFILCTNAIAIPSQCVDFIQIVKEKNLRISHLKYLMIGGAPISAALVNTLKDSLESVNVLAALGMTETSGMTFMVSPDDSLEKVSTTVGYVSDHIEVKVVDTEGRMVPMGTPGELWVRGYSSMLGYWGQPDKTREVKQEDGWLKTGDQFILTEDGYGSVVGRLKEMIIRENVNLFPLEIEQFLQSHPDILDVQAFGVPDPKVSEEMCVYIRTRDRVTLTEEDVRDFCKGQIADWKIPRYIMFVENFPRSATGKVAKQQLKKMALEQLGLNKGENLLYVPGIQ